MYGGGGSSKHGRGGGISSGGGRSRNSFPPPPPPLAQNRPSTGRLSLGSSNPRNSNHRSVSSATEENFQLVPGNNPPAFGMMIRLAPDLVEEIRRVESQGGSARIRFDNIGTNPGGNVINVDGKEFRFTWSSEFDDRCDLYEQRRSGENGNGLLVESGCAWRKLNVQRVLDESMTNHVKMRSEEAERKNKSRKAIILDHDNPSMKSQLKQMAAVESNPWKSFKNKKEPPVKKRKVDPPLAPPKSSYIPGLTSTTTVRGGRSTSPLPSTTEQYGVEDVSLIPAKGKDNTTSSENEFPSRTFSAVRQTPEGNINFGAKPMDTQSMLISLLKENPKGMSLKALEKAVGDTIPNSAKKIEPIIKKIANFQAPGRYILKPGVDLDGFKKKSSESGSSPEVNRNFTPADEDSPDHALLLESIFEEKIPVGEPDERPRMNSAIGDESYLVEKPDIYQQSTDLFGERKVPENNEGKHGSSSDSDSDRDSDSSDSDSGSHSRSRSRSPNSDSETGAYSNSKEGSDEDVDIIANDDVKERGHKVLMNEMQDGDGSYPIDIEGDDDPIDIEGDDDPIDIEGDDPIDIEGDGSDPVDILGDGSDPIDIEGQGSDAIDIEGNGSDVDIEKDLPYEENESEMAIDTGLIPNPPFDHVDLQERQKFIVNLFGDKEETFKDNINHERSDSPERVSKSKSKRASDTEHYDKKPERSIRSKAKNSVSHPISGSRESQFSESTRNLSPNLLTDDSYRGPDTHWLNRCDGEGNHDFGKGYNPASTGKSSSDLQQSSRRSSEQGAQTKGHDGAGRPNRYDESSTRDQRFPDKSSGANEGFCNRREKASRDIQNEDFFLKEKNVPRNSQEVGVGGKNSVPLGSYRKPNEMSGKFKDAAQVPGLPLGLPKDNIKIASSNGQRSVLQRELSDLELGELREPFSEEIPVKKQFERKDSFKPSGNRSSTSDSDFSRGKPSGKGTLDNKKPSPPNPNTAMGHRAEETIRSHRVAQSQPLPVSRIDNNTEGRLPLNRSSDTTSKSRLKEGDRKQGTGVEGYDESHKQAPVSALPQRDPKRGQGFHSKERITQTPNTRADFTDRRKDTTSIDGINAARKRNGSEEDEDSSYSKYEKDEPELKGPIKNFIQYREYVLEYQDKYDSYCALNKILESFRNEFEDYGKELEYAKGSRDTDRYNEIVEKLRESYGRCGTRNQRLKKIFEVLHEELKNLKQRMKDFALSHAKD